MQKSIKVKENMGIGNMYLKKEISKLKSVPSF